MATRQGIRTAALALAALLLGLVVHWLEPVPAHACSCVTDSEPELIRSAEVIFTGSIVGDRAWGDTRTYTFDVDRVYRSQVRTAQTVKTHTQGPACGLELPGAGPYLVMGYRQDGVLWANSCGGTRAGAAPAELGDGYPPQPGASESPVPWVVLGGVILVLATIGILPAVVRRRSARPKG
jgi:hypothetical protein